MNKTVIIESGKYLSEVIDQLPSHCLINKGITGCGGTTLELESKRNSIILCPTRNLVTSKSSLGYFGVDGNVTMTKIREYVMKESGYKKIIATYDALEKIMKTISNYNEYFLLVDEYHLLFNDYSFRNKPIKFILDNFKNFDNWAFMTATPLKEEFILDELKDIDQINYQWNNSVPVRMIIKDTFFIQKELINLIESISQEKNLHIFINSVSTISKIVSKLDQDYRVVCSENSKTKIKNFAKITDPVKKLNFYTSCAFEGCDINDSNGICVIVCDTNISTSMLDIATKIRQVCGRLRDSKYKDECYLILNTNKHRYAKTSRKEFETMVADGVARGELKAKDINNKNAYEYETELKLYNPETYTSIYLNKYDNKIFYDPNLKKMDIYNYNLINEIYSSTISVLSEMNNNKIVAKVEKVSNDKGLAFIKNILESREYTYGELEQIFTPIFKEHNLKWNKKTSIKNYFPNFTKRYKMVNGEREMYYKFDL